METDESSVSKRARDELYPSLSAGEQPTHAGETTMLSSPLVEPEAPPPPGAKEETALPTGSVPAHPPEQQPPRPSTPTFPVPPDPAIQPFPQPPGPTVPPYSQPPGPTVPPYPQPPGPTIPPYPQPPGPTVPPYPQPPGPTVPPYLQPPGPTVPPYPQPPGTAIPPYPQPPGPTVPPYPQPPGTAIPAFPPSSLPASQASPQVCDGAHPLLSPEASQELLDALKEDHDETKDEDREYSILIIGKTGNGKSSLANTIIGVKHFAVGRGMAATTKEAQAVTVHVNGKRLKVVDTPDFTNLTSYTAEARKHVQQWKRLTDSKPDVIIQVVRCDVRYTKEEHDIYRQTQKLWGDKSLFRQRLLVAFTIGDEQDEDLETELEVVNDELKSVLADARKRFVQVNNRAKGEEKTKQLEAICHMLNTVIAQNERPEAAGAKGGKGEGSQEICVLVVGKTGHGKSSVGNLLTGRDSFLVGTGLSTVTKTTRSDRVFRAGRWFTVVDTPELPLRDSHEQRRQIEEWKRMTSPHPVVILLVIRCDVRFVSEEFTIYQDLKRLWSQTEPTAVNRLVVVFTFRDRLDYNLQEHVTRHPELTSILGDAGGTMLAVNTKASGREREEAVMRLLSCIDQQGEGCRRANASVTLGRPAASKFDYTGEPVEQLKRFLQCAVL